MSSANGRSVKGPQPVLGGRRPRDRAPPRRESQFTALLHHVTVEALERAFRRLKRRAAPGVDAEGVTSYEQALAAKLGRPARACPDGAVPASPGPSRVHPQGGQRTKAPGHPGARRQDRPERGGRGAECHLRSRLHGVLVWLPAVRPGKSPHQALTALHTALMTQCVNRVLDADIRRFFGSSMLRPTNQRKRRL
jgi:RNA-directed DNA polymerase